MFNESSSFRFDLFRRVKAGRRSRVVPMPDGEIRLRGPRGEPQTLRWSDRVHDSNLSSPGVLRHASYGLDAQLFRLQRALDDFASHVPEGDDTEAILALTQGTRNGRAEPPHWLVGVRR
jgi:hypothetical protein